DRAVELGAVFDAQVALHVDVALEAAGDADVAGAFDLAFDGQIGGDQGFLRDRFGRGRGGGRTGRADLGGAEVGNSRSLPWRCRWRRIGREGGRVLACVGVALGGENGHVASSSGWAGTVRAGAAARQMGALEPSTS